MQNANTNKDNTTFIYILFSIILTLLLFVLSLVIFINKGGLEFYTLIIKTIFAFTMIVCIYLINILFLVILITKNDTFPKHFLNFIDTSIKLIYPIMIIFANIFRIDKNPIRRVFSQINNKIVIMKEIDIEPENIIILAPHCLQNSTCKYKITGDINNCRRCGKCNVDDLLKLQEMYPIHIEIVTGGTLARKLINDYKPKGIIAIACERDLSSGLLDVKSIPVIGITNKRPEGPCFNTCIDINEVKEAVKLISRR